MSESITISIATEKEIPLAINFLSAHEHTAVSLMSRLLKTLKSNNNHTTYVVKDKNIIKGVFIITFSGIVLHHVLSQNITNLLKPILKKRNLFSIAGCDESSVLFEAALNKKPTLINNYHIMILNRSINVVPPIHIIDKNFIVFKCSQKDANDLYSLQRRYQIEEVLPPGQTLTEKVCRSIVNDRLNEHTVFAIKDISNDKLISMAGTNATGLHYIQLGGIYTDSSYRNRGLAQRLVCELIAQTDKDISLFVRTENYPAIKAYKNAGFSIKDSYRICYM